MREITPHLWFDKEAREAAELYTSAFPDSEVTDVTTIYDTPSGDADVVSFSLCAQPFMAISAGPMFTFNPSISFLVSCAAAEEVDELWAALSDGGTALMELGAYPFSPRYGWTEDRYGLSWQIMQTESGTSRQRITPTLMFVGEVAGKAEEAMRFYTSVLPRSGIGDIDRWEDRDAAEVAGTIKHATFTLSDQQFAAMDSALEAHKFAFNEAVSLMLPCDSQDEIDLYWERLSAVPEAEQCGWLKDRYGVSWQVVPARLEEMMSAGTDEQRARVTQSFLSMKKFDLAQLERAYVGAADRSPGAS